jgi:hypothetical protein
MADKATSEQLRREAEKLWETAAQLMEQASALIEKSAALEKKILVRSSPARRRRPRRSAYYQLRLSTQYLQRL